MILVNIDIPETCRECPMSCQHNAVNEETQRLELQILCRVDWRRHKPMDNGCPIKGEVKENRWTFIVPGDQVDEDDD